MRQRGRRWPDVAQGIPNYPPLSSREREGVTYYIHPHLNPPPSRGRKVLFICVV